MASKKITSDDAFKIEQENNERKFIELLKLVRPELFVLMDTIDQTNINWFVVVKIIRQLNNIAIGSKWGSVEIQIQDGRVLFVNGIDKDRLDEPLLQPKKE